MPIDQDVVVDLDPGHPALQLVEGDASVVGRRHQAHLEGREPEGQRRLLLHREAPEGAPVLAQAGAHVDDEAEGQGGRHGPTGWPAHQVRGRRHGRPLKALSLSGRVATRRAVSVAIVGCKYGYILMV